MNAPRLLVIGGGITGLAAAYQGVLVGAEVTLVESSADFGGKLVTSRLADGLIIDEGPDSFVTYRPGATGLLRDLGIADELIGTQGTRKVALRSRGRLRPLPDGMGQVPPTKLGPFVATGILSWADKLRAAGDLFLPRLLDDQDVAIGEFLGRRLGPGIVHRFADPLVGGIYGSSVDELSLDAVLPTLRRNEQQYRSLLLASLATGRAQRRSAKPAAGGAGSIFASLRGGMACLPAACVAALQGAGAELRSGVSVTSLHWQPAGTVAELSDGTQLNADKVILAGGAASSAALLAEQLPDAAQALRAIPLASTTLVTMAWPASSFAAVPERHGWLEADDAPISGVTISSAKWAGRAPAETVLVRAFVPDRVRRHGPADLNELPDAVVRHVQPVLRVNTAPRIWVRHWRAVMPKYTVGHLDRVAVVDQALAAHRPNWRLAGSALHGVGVPDCISDGRRAATELLASSGGSS